MCFCYFTSSSQVGLCFFWALRSCTDMYNREIPLHHDAVRVNGQDYLEAMKHQKKFVWHVHIFNSSPQTWYVNYSHWGSKKMQTYFRNIMSSFLGPKNLPSEQGKIKGMVCLLHAAPTNCPSQWFSIPLVYGNIQTVFCQLCWLMITPYPVMLQPFRTAKGLVRTLSHSSDMMSRWRTLVTLS